MLDVALRGGISISFQPLQGQRLCSLGAQGLIRLKQSQGSYRRLQGSTRHWLDSLQLPVALAGRPLLLIATYAGKLLCKAHSHLQQALSSFRAGLARLPKFGGPWSLLWSKQVNSWKACTSSVPHEHSVKPKPALASHRLSSTGHGAGAKLSNQCLLRLPLWLC